MAAAAAEFGEESNHLAGQAVDRGRLTRADPQGSLKLRLVYPTPVGRRKGLAWRDYRESPFRQAWPLAKRW